MSKYRINNTSTLSTQAIRRREGLTKRGVSVLLLLVISIVGVTYVIRTNTTATGGFIISDLEERRDTLMDEHLKLERNVAELRSFQQIRTSAEQLDLVAKAHPEYVAPSPGSVALDR